MLKNKCFKLKIKEIKFIPKKLFSSSKIKNKEDFNLSFDIKTKFSQFYEQTISNSKILSENEQLLNTKLSDKIQSQGLEKTKQDLEKFNSIIKEKKIGEVYRLFIFKETLRYMDYSAFEKYQQSINDQKAKFGMPLGGAGLFLL